MGDRTGNVLLLPLIAILAVVLPGAINGARQPPAAAAVLSARETLTAQSTSTSQPRTAAGLIHEYYELTSAPAAAPGRHKAARCLIATLPDPVDAGNISYMFDRYLDATQRAMEVVGFVLDRFDVPWLDKEPGDRYRREPARLLFHGGPREQGVPEVALLFLVGETPTAGIHKIAFARAIDEIATSCGAPDYVPVVGPSFSGSQASLRTLLEQYKDQKQFDIVSGSATAVESDNLIPPGANASFRRTITPDAILRGRLYEIVRASEDRPASFLRALAVPRKPASIRLAMLFEGNTSFGASFGQPEYQSQAAGIYVTEIPFPLHISRLRAAARQNEPANAESLDLVGRRQPLTRLELHESAAQRTVVPLQSRLETSSMEIVLSSLLRTLDEQDVRYVSVVATDVQDLIFLGQQIRHHLPNTVLFLFSNDLLFLHPDVNTDLRGARIISPYPLFLANQQWTSGSSRELLFPSNATQGVYNATLTALGHAADLQEYGHPRRAASPPPLWLSIVGADQIWPVRYLEAPSPPTMVPAPSRHSGETWRLWTPGHPWLALFAIALGWIPTLYLMSNAGARWAPGGLGARFRTGPLAELFSESIFPQHQLQRRIYLLRCWSAVATPYVLCTFMLLLPWTVWGVRPAIVWTRSSGTLIVEVVLALGLILVAVGLVALTRLACTDGENGIAHVRGAVPVLTTSRQSDRRLRPAVSWVLVPLGFAAGTAIVWLFDRNETADDAIFLYLRGTDLASGVSPLLPLLFFSGAALTWAVTSLRRLRLLEGPSQYPVVRLHPEARELTRSFLGFAGGSFQGIDRLEHRLFEAIGQSSRSLTPTALIWIVGITLVAALSLFVRRGVPSVEGAAFDVLFMFSFFVVNLASALAMVRLMLIWHRLSRLLRRLAWHPTIKAYARLATRIPGKPKINLTGQSQIFTALEFSVDRAAELVAKARELTGRVAKSPERHALAPLVDLLRPPPPPSPPPSPQFTDAVRTHLVPLSDEVQCAQDALDRALEAAAGLRWKEKVAARTDAEQHLSCIAGEVTKMLKEAWRLPASYWVRTATEKPDEAAILEAAEDFLASRVAALLSHVVPQLQNLVVCVITVLLLLLIGVTSYPLQPHQLLLRFVTIEILAAVTVVLFLFVQMERDTILSALSESTPGQISWSRDFISRVAVYVLLPLLGVLGAQFPEVFQQFFSWTRTSFTTH